MQQSGQQFKAFQFVIDKTWDNRIAKNLEQNLAIRHTVKLEIKLLKVCHEMKFSKVAAARELDALQGNTKRVGRAPVSQAKSCKARIPRQQGARPAAGLPLHNQQVRNRMTCELNFTHR